HPIVLPSPPRFRFFPSGLDEAGTLEAMEYGIEHPVGPLQLAPGQLTNPLQDGVAVAVPFGQDGENQRRRRRRDEILVDAQRTDLLRPSLRRPSEPTAGFVEEVAARG